ncbi:AAA family ATPase [Paraliomyxa miuraensis]|uniref:AAA family ATPase n=1 Tax=Paraliomyxa miuraensis TaxID=376150 RepID=UPI0022569395|nr:AAA family ATPase [Paraliomyxa miuraensis]MCX4246265.1 AAA family ATPase [Paraliomyxa miuraensis]
MRLLSLALENIGPFDRAELRFLDEADDEVPVAFVTGENGTGKSIVLDAIRGLFGGPELALERNITREGGAFVLGAHAVIDDEPVKMGSRQLGESQTGFVPEDSQSAHERVQSRFSLLRKFVCPDWVLDYWRPGIPSGTHGIQSLTKPDLHALLEGSLQGTLRNAEVTELICFFDYLRDSRSAEERRAGDLLYAAIEKIIAASVLDGGLDHVERSTLTPIIKQSGQLVPISNLSAGNAYLIQRLIGLLGKMYAVHVLRQTPPEELCNTPGLLLIDEAESHLHPRWQKRFVRDVLGVFPNLQIIATTHSPFILASTPGARVFVCRYDREAGACVIEQQHESFANKPIDEVVLSGAFDGTQPFGPEISDLLERRAAAVRSGDDETRRYIERELQRLNPQYFGFLDVEERLRALGGGG